MNGSDINMDYNELLVPVIDNETSAPATGSEVKGQMYMNTTDNTMYFYNGTAWVEMDGSGSGVSSFQATDGTYIDFAPNTSFLLLRHLIFVHISKTSRALLYLVSCLGGQRRL